MTGSRPLTTLEIQAIIATFSGKYEVRNTSLFLLGLNTGARISELLSLNVGDVWRYNRPVDIIYFQKRHTKGKLQGRQITIKSGGKKAILDLILWKRKQGEALAKDAPLFVSRHHKRLGRKQAHNILKAAFDACQLSGVVTTHSLRKTFANHVLRASDGNIRVLQELLGHRHLSTTEVYLGITSDELLSAVPDFGELDIRYVSSNSDKIIPLRRRNKTSKKARQQ